MRERGEVEMETLTDFLMLVIGVLVGWICGQLGWLFGQFLMERWKR